jgi:hypothetical protein
MQDRSRQFDEIFLQRTAGPYIWVKLRSDEPFADSLLYPKSGHRQTGLNGPFRAKSGLCGY